MNRQFVGCVADLHFAPTEGARQNLLREGKAPESIVVTGNTAIDALQTTVREDYSDEILQWAKGSRLIVLTAHRRENLGEPMHRMFRAIRRVVEEFPDVKVVYPVHLNPLVQKAAEEELGGCDRVKLIAPWRSSSSTTCWRAPPSSSPTAAASRRRPSWASRLSSCGTPPSAPRALPPAP